METRTITQVKIWKLILNPMMGRCEDKRVVAISPNKEKLIEWYKSRIVSPYTDEGGWHKVFSKGSLLEWFNPPHYDIDKSDENPFSDEGIKWEWISEEDLEKAKQRYEFVNE